MEKKCHNSLCKELIENHLYTYCNKCSEMYAKCSTMVSYNKILDTV